MKPNLARAKRTLSLTTPVCLAKLDVLYYCRSHDKENYNADPLNSLYQYQHALMPPNKHVIDEMLKNITKNIKYGKYNDVINPSAYQPFEEEKKRSKDKKHKKHKHKAKGKDKHGPRPVGGQRH